MRKLNSHEKKEAESVFRDGIDFAPVKLRERTRLALTVAKGWSRFMCRPDPASNAMTIGNTILVSRKLRTNQSESDSQRFIDMAWLIHELIHVWQFQRFSWRMLDQVGM